MPFTRRIVRAAAVIALAAFAAVASATSASAATYTQVSLNAVVSGTSVTATAYVKASQTTTVSYVGISLTPDPSNVDIVQYTNKSITSSASGTMLQGTRANLAPGTYTYDIYLSENGSQWLTVGASKTFTIVAPPASTMPVGDLPGWKQNLAQDFNTPAALGQVGAVYGGAMAGYDGFNDTSGRGLYKPSRVLSVSNGALDFNLHTEAGQPLVAAPAMNDWNPQTYGRYSVRFKSDNMPGYKIAFLLWPQDGDWNQGEIDWPEGNLTTGTKMSPASAIKGSYSNGHMTFDPPNRVYSATDASAWHVATTEWTPGLVKWFWDGVLVGQTTIPSGVPTVPMQWYLQAETNLDGAAIPATTNGHLLVDWAVSYTKV